uniref:Phosphatidic acid phosphatase type 2/haloperoxidase domain-containing protein n=1 Tax=viral metagenome TaxID=1070528 RepID=A0A6C0HM06_9ZZZZ
MSLSLIDVAKILINTLVRLEPIGLYAGSAMSAVVFSDFRAVLLFIGFLGNELVSLGYRMVLRGGMNPQCAFLYSSDNDPFILPSPITQTIGFFAGFFFMDMYYKNQFSMLKFFFLIALIIVTIYSRINIGCKTLIDAIYCILIGLLVGVVYYNIIKDYYKADYLNQETTIANSQINSFFSLN